MNKKGFIGGANSFVFGMFGLAILIFIVVALSPIQSGDVEVSEMMSSLNTTQHATMNKFIISDDNNPVVNILHSLLGFVFYSTFEVVKLSVEFSLDNPGFMNAKTILWIIIISLSIPIVYYLCAMLLLIFLSIKEMSQSLADKRKLKRLEQNKTKQNESKRI